MRPAVGPLAWSTHPPPPAPYLRPHDQRRFSPSRLGLSREGSLTSPRPSATSANSPSSAGAGSRNNQVQGWGQKGGGMKGRSAKCAALPGRPTAAYSPPAAITSTKWRPGAESRRFDHHPPTEGARSGWPRLLVAIRHRTALGRSDWQAAATSPCPVPRANARKWRKGVVIGQSGEARFLEAWLPSKTKDKRKLCPFHRRARESRCDWLGTAPTPPPKCHRFLFSKERSRPLRQNSHSLAERSGKWLL